MKLSLVPVPKKIQYRSGQFRVTPQTRLFVPAEIPPPLWHAAVDVRNCLSRAAEGTILMDRLGLRPEKEGVFFSVTPRRDANPEGYTLEVDSRQLRLDAPTPVGLFYGAQTLKQIVGAFGSTLPAMKIEDEPDFAHRGFYHDVTRGKVPTLATLRELTRNMAYLKMNQLQLYVEHTFAFRFDPDIAQGCSPLTADEILALDAHCAHLNIDLVPSIQSFGHMGHILSLPRYRALAEVQVGKTWEEMSWRERMHGMTLDPSNPKSLALLEKMFDNFLPLFQSKYVNVCCDETWDLGTGKNRQRAEALGEKERASGRDRPGKGSTILYIEFMHKINRLCKRHGKKMMFWGDIVIRHPQLIDRLPKDAILLNWGYGADHNVDSTGEFTKRHLETYVCPGTSGWNRIVNGVDNAEINIRRFAEAGRKYGAVGVLNTDWGDCGHYNLLACSYHGLALGAAAAWNGKGCANKTDFDRAFCTAFFGDRTGKVMRAVRKVSWAGARSTWIALQRPFADAEAGKGFTAAEVLRLEKAGWHAAAEFASLLHPGERTTLDLLELGHACEMSALLGMKLRLARELKATPKGKRSPRLAREFRHFATALQSRLDEYVILWRVRNKESNLRDIVAVLKALIREAKGIAKRLA